MNIHNTNSAIVCCVTTQLTWKGGMKAVSRVVVLG